MTDDFVLLYMTAPDTETAERIAGALIEARLAACANIFPEMHAVYRWRGAIESAAEVAVVFKTSAARAEAASARIAALHPYEVPCVISLPISAVGSHPGYLAWIGQETRPD